MNNNMWTEDEMRKCIRRRLGCYKTQKEMAEDIGVSESLLSKMLKGERSVSDDVAQIFGRKLVRLYVIPVEQERRIS